MVKKISNIKNLGKKLKLKKTSQSGGSHDSDIIQVNATDIESLKDKLEAIRNRIEHLNLLKLRVQAVMIDDERQLNLLSDLVNGITMFSGKLNEIITQIQQASED